MRHLHYENHFKEYHLLLTLKIISQNTAFHSLRERLRTHKVITKDQCFYLNNRKFSIKSYVLDVY